MGELDASVFHRYAEYLWRRAGGVVLRSTLIGAAVGAGLGAVMLSSWAHWPVPHREAYLLILLGAIAGAVLGRSLGTSRALGLRLQAQLAQHQLEFERSTLARATPEEPQEEEPAPRVVARPYLPSGVPLLSAADPGESVPVLPATSETYGWAAFDPSGQ